MMRVYSKMSAIMPNVFNKRAMRKLMLMCFLSPDSQDLLESLSLSLMYSVFTDCSDSECSSLVLDSSSLSELKVMFISAAFAWMYAFFFSLYDFFFLMLVLTGYLLHSLGLCLVHILWCVHQ